MNHSSSSSSKIMCSNSKIQPSAILKVRVKDRHVGLMEPGEDAIHAEVVVEIVLEADVVEGVVVELLVTGVLVEMSNPDKIKRENKMFSSVAAASNFFYSPSSFCSSGMKKEFFATE